jgi:hypothetical protein
MRISKYLWLVGLLLLVSLIALGPRPVAAQQLAPATINDFQITTLDDKPVTDSTLMAGATYKVDFTIAVAAGLKENCILKTSLIRSPGSDRFWTLKGDYPGIDSASWQPGESTLSFNAVEGNAQMELVGSVPSDYATESLPNGQTLHLTKKIPIVALSLESGTVIADRQLDVIDSSVQEYLSALSARQTLVTDMNADPAYSNLAKALLTSAEAEASAGQTDLAMETLKAIPSSGWIEPRGSTYFQWIIIGILAVLLAGSAFMLIKARGELNFFRRQTDSQAKSLQVLAKKASRVGDPALTAGIEQMRKELEQSIGGS